MFSLFFSLFLGCTTTASDDSAQENVDTALDFENIELGVQAGEDWTECVQYIGYRPCDLILKDQNDEYFSLYDHEGDVIVLDFSAGWCGPCKTAAATVQQTQDQYGDQGFVYITVLIEDDTANSANLSFVQEWADQYHIETAPVLQGSRHLIDHDGIEGYNLTAWPTFYVIDREMKLDSGIRGFDEEWVHRHIQDLL